ncbi:Acetyltransferase (GNAT) family protein [Pseudomonas sp. ok272]|uniref:GNAT family N-acetyltransferase n=1 Tax=unclassified Pseudomonas TaxID=196821 RepID=UPI0008C1D192|nr:MULTISPECIES: GNAT family N-acetyltransferase [unclassified Pseudomonas]SEN31315.1 Acetyltransferase (GNAT) family protein [Pseudomonas sp. ok272]SFN19303.1 Acetyltransferase (GNAT) family protein [Pseudomonas sp. ok602]
MSETFCLLMRRDLGGELPAALWPAGIHLSEYRPAVADVVHHLLCVGYQDGSGQVPALDTWRARFETDAEYAPSLCLIAADAQGIVGVAQGWTSAYLKDLVVHPRAQGQGLGRALLLHSFKMFQQRRERCMDLKVLEDNHRARRLYESAGMRVVCREPVPT